jgi:acyl carrier protein|tara:strand:+ start:235 stop:507 length:273 start_codon:yes stop_codon:yes gene_type:complete
MKNKLDIIYLNIFVKVLKISKKIQKRLLEDKEDIGLNNFQNWDSMQHVKILINISEKFKIKVNTKNSNKFNSYQSGVKYLRKTKNLYSQT